MNLPEPGEALVLADGTVINTDDGSVVSSPEPIAATPNVTKTGDVKPGRKYVEIPRISEAQEIVTRVRRRVGDLPRPPETMNVVAVVLAYHFYGLDATDIAIATKLSEHQVNTIMMGEAFTAMQSSILTSMSERGKTDVREYFQQASKMAAENLADIAFNSPDDGVRLRATDSILDRAGHRAVDTVEHKVRMENDLVIRVIKDESKLPPMIELNPEEV